MMKHPLLKGLTLVVVSFSLLGLVIIANQTVQLVRFAHSIQPGLGYLVLVGLLVIYAVIILLPTVAFLRMPPALKVPDSEASPEFQTYIQGLGQRLAANPALKGTKLSFKTRSEVEHGLKLLDSQADELIRRSAATVFVSTAISQNGRLDGLLVLMTQGRLIWQLLSLYHQRPHWRETLSIYSNVLATALVATSLEDLDITEQLEPVITSVFGSGLVGAIPGASIAATIVTNSLVEGTANAYLTLRVGLICKQYSTALTRPEKQSVRRFASVQAAAMLGGIVKESAGQVVQAAGQVLRQMGSGMVANASSKIPRLFRTTS